jgi:hypothetical protein
MVNTGFMRQNYHGMTADLICLCCFRTVAESKPVGELAAEENNHVCTPFEDLVAPQPDPLHGLYG